MPPEKKGVIEMAEKISVLFTEEEVDARIRELGEQISKEYAGKAVHLICVLKGASFFACELAKESQCLFIWTLCLFPVMEGRQNPAAWLEL